MAVWLMRKPTIVVSTRSDTDHSDSLNHNAGGAVMSWIRAPKVSLGIVAAVAILCSQAKADEGGVSFWVPGLFGSLAPTPQQPGWAVASIYYHTTVSAGGSVAAAREFTIGKIPLNLSGTLNANLNASGDIGLIAPSYVFATPFLGGQAALTVLATYGTTSASVAGTLMGSLGLPGGGSIPFMRSDSISNTAWGFGDLAPQFAVRWNAGVNNYMTHYITGDIPVGVYSSSSLANLGIGHGAVDAGGGATPISIQRPGTSSRRCSASPTISSISRRNIRTAWTCTSIGACRSSCPSRCRSARSATFTISCRATAARGTTSVALNRAWPASDHAGRIHLPSGRNAGLSQFQRLRGVRLVGSARRLERMGHAGALAGPGHARRYTDQTYVYEIGDAASRMATMAPPPARAT